MSAARPEDVRAHRAPSVCGGRTSARRHASTARRRDCCNATSRSRDQLSRARIFPLAPQRVGAHADWAAAVIWCSFLALGRRVPVDMPRASPRRRARSAGEARRPLDGHAAHECANAARHLPPGEHEFHLVLLAELRVDGARQRVQEHSRAARRRLAQLGLPARVTGEVRDERPPRGLPLVRPRTSTSPWCDTSLRRRPQRG